MGHLLRLLSSKQGPLSASMFIWVRVIGSVADYEPVMKIPLGFTAKAFGSCPEGQVAQKKRLLHPTVAHNCLTVAMIMGHWLSR